MGLYEYSAEVLRVVDGDTIWLTWKDYGDGLRVRGGDTAATALAYRLAGVNAYEKTLRGDTTPEEKALGIAATHWLIDLIEGKRIILQSVKAGEKGGFGRYLAFVYLDKGQAVLNPVDPDSCINCMLLEKGFAVVSKYEDGEVYEGLGYPREQG